MGFMPVGTIDEPREHTSVHIFAPDPLSPGARRQSGGKRLPACTIM
jgi:hypothetical protein